MLKDDFDADLMEMMVEMKKPLFAGSAGRDLGFSLALAGAGARVLTGGPAFHVPGAPKPRRRGGKKSPVYAWIMEAVAALDARCNMAGPWDKAVGSGAVWDKLLEQQGWRLDDPLQEDFLAEHESSLRGILVRDRRGVTGGVGQGLQNLVNRGHLQLLHKDDPRNIVGRNLFFIVIDTVAARLQQAAGSSSGAGSSALGKRPARAAAAKGESKRRKAVVEDSDSEEELPMAQSAHVSDSEDDLFGSDADSDVEMDEHLDTETATNIQQGIIQSQFEMERQQLAIGSRSLAARGFTQETDPTKMKPWIAHYADCGWTQWWAYRHGNPDCGKWVLAVSPDGQFQTDVLDDPERKRNGGKGGLKQWIEDNMAPE